MIWAAMAAFIRNRSARTQSIVFGSCCGLFIAAGANATHRNPAIGSVAVWALAAAGVTGLAFHLVLRDARRHRWVRAACAVAWLGAVVAAGLALFGQAGVRVAAITIVPIVLLAPFAFQGVQAPPFVRRVLHAIGAPLRRVRARRQHAGRPGRRPAGADEDASGQPSRAPQRPKLVLAALITVAAVANLNLAVANVALPDIGKAFDAGQTQLDLVAVGFSLGLAASVLYLGAIGDRYGRKLMLILGMALSIPASLLAALAPTVTVLFLARVMGGLAAGMAFPTTLALITALWSGPARTRSIALWSAIGGAITALGPLTAGALLEQFDWSSVFVVTIPLAVVALIMAWRLVPAHVNETSDPVDNLGGIISILFVGAVVLSINFAAEPGQGTLAIGLGVIGVAAAVAFVISQRRARIPLYDLDIASRRIFWVAACAGMVVFGSLIGAMFIGQQFLQNVLQYSTLDAGLAILPGAVFMVLIAPNSAKLVERRGSRLTLLIGYAFCLLGFLTMLLLWEEGISYWKVGLAFAFVGAGVGFAGTPASRALTGSVPVKRAGMASATADLQRDLGGAIMQSILGSLLTAGYSASFASQIASNPQGNQISDSVQNTLEKSFSSAANLAQQNPQYASQIVSAAKTSFLQGDQWAYTAGVVAILIGAALVFFLFPKKAHEDELRRSYQAEDAGRIAEPSRPPAVPAPQPA